MAKHGTMRKVILGMLAAMLAASALLAVAAFVAAPIVEAGSVQPDSPCESCQTIGYEWHCNHVGTCPPEQPDGRYEVIRCCDQCLGYCQTWYVFLYCAYHSACH